MNHIDLWMLTFAPDRQEKSTTIQAVHDAADAINVHGGRGDVLTGWAQHFNDAFNTEDWSIALTFHNKAETNETN